MNIDKLTQLAEIKVLGRIAYAPLSEPKPHDHCYADEWIGAWMENDEHYRNRIKSEICDSKNK